MGQFLSKQNLIANCVNSKIWIQPIIIALYQLKFVQIPYTVMQGVLRLIAVLFYRLKASAEQQFLYGHNVTKAGLGRITENTEKYTGVIVYSMSDLPLGFGVAAKSTAECRHADPMGIVCFHQVDVHS